MTTAKDANGVALKVGDTVRHRLEPAEGLADGNGDAVHNFAGSAEVVEIIAGMCVRTRPNCRGSLPVYCSANVVLVSTA